MLPDSEGESALQTSFERDAVRVVEPFEGEIEGRIGLADDNTTKSKPFCLKHAMSTPNFRTVLEECSDDDEAVLVGNNSQTESQDGAASLASSSMVMVSESPSVISIQSSWSSASKISFRDAIMKKKAQETDQLSAVKEAEGAAQQRDAKKTKKRPKFVVTPIKRCAKSTGDLRSLARIAETGGGDDDVYNNDLVLGDTDAELYYSQKLQGKLGRKNGQKSRPDEAKRLQITMAKKENQRQRQKEAAMKKR